MFALILYNLLLLVLSPIILLGILAQVVLGGKTRKGQLERMGFIARKKVAGEGPCVWLHAVSVGETVAAKPIWQAMMEALPGWRLLYSATTDTGHDMAAKAVGDRGQLIYFPYDLLPFAWLALRRARPGLVVLVETELWPNFLLMARLMGCKVLVVNGRISERSLRGAARFGAIYRWMTAQVDRFCMQSAIDAERIIRLGADPARVTVAGNSKFDQVGMTVTLGEQVTLRDAMGLKRDEPVLLAGSTHPGEEEVILRAFRQVRQTDPTVRLVIAPRDIRRGQELEELCAAHGFAAARRTRIATVPAPPEAVIILDTIGELGRAYALCVAAFVGGSFDTTGGHNVLEPLAFGKPTMFGPNMSNFRDISAITLAAGIGFQVKDDAELAAQWSAFLGDPARCRAIAERAATVFVENCGASRRCAEEAAQLVSGRGARQPVA